MASQVGAVRWVAVAEQELHGQVGAVHLEPLVTISLLCQANIVQQAAETEHFVVVVDARLQALALPHDATEDVGAHAVVDKERWFDRPHPVLRRRDQSATRQVQVVNR